MVFVMMENVNEAITAASNVYTSVMENDRVRVLKATFNPGDIAKMHQHPDHVVYVLEGGKMTLSNYKGKTDTLDLKTGSAIFLDAQAHEAQNIGQSVIDLLVVELKK